MEGRQRYGLFLYKSLYSKRHCLQPYRLKVYSPEQFPFFMRFGHKTGVIMKLSTLIIVAMFSLAQPIFAAESGQNLLLFYSNDVHGETAPCG